MSSNSSFALSPPSSFILKSPPPTLLSGLHFF
jgi:hypothetical protein